MCDRLRDASVACVGCHRDVTVPPPYGHTLIAVNSIILMVYEIVSLLDASVALWSLF